MKTFTQPMQGLKEFEDLEAALPKTPVGRSISGSHHAMGHALNDATSRATATTCVPRHAAELANASCLQLMSFRLAARCRSPSLTRSLFAVQFILVVGSCLRVLLARNAAICTRWPCAFGAVFAVGRHCGCGGCVCHTRRQ